MVSAVYKIRQVLCLKLVLPAIIFSMVSLGIVTLSPSCVMAADYSNPPFTNPRYDCSTGVGCCRNVQALVHNEIKTNLEQAYYVRTLWPMIELALKRLADDFRNVNLLMTSTMGAMLDGQTFNQTLLSLQKQSVDSLAAQTASDQICRFGTLARSLSKSEDKTKLVQLGLTTQMMNRQLMRANMNSAQEKTVGSDMGRSSDKAGRFVQLEKTFCDPEDSNGTLGESWCLSSVDTRRNRDIDVTRSLYNPVTLQMDFSETDGEKPTPDEQNIFALSNNLYAHDLPVNMARADFEAIGQSGGTSADGKIEKILDYRALIAKRNVAQNSFAALAAMKVEGSEASAQYMKEMIAQLGLDTGGQNFTIGAKPSYDAQMEFLTRKLYQSPSFYANLMESTANIARQQSAMESIGLMQDRDIYESLRRSEMVLSSLLEMYVMKEQSASTDKGVR